MFQKTQSKISAVLFVVKHSEVELTLTNRITFTHCDIHTQLNNYASLPEVREHHLSISDFISH